MPQDTPMLATAVPDLRKEPRDEVIDRVECSLQTRLDRATVMRKRRSTGLASDRGTWVRIEMRSIDRITGQGWNGVEAAAVLRCVSKPAWRQGVAWHDAERGVMWRADETDLVTDAPDQAGRNPHHRPRALECLVGDVQRIAGRARRPTHRASSWPAANYLLSGIRRGDVGDGERRSR
jgi:hypothetical protein